MFGKFEFRGFLDFPRAQLLACGKISWRGRGSQLSTSTIGLPIQKVVYHWSIGIIILLYTTDVYHWTNLIIVPLMFSAIVYYSVVFTDFTAASLPRHWRTMPRYFAGWNVAWLAMDVAEAEGYSLDECWPRVAWATYNFNYLCLILFIYIYIS